MSEDPERKRYDHNFLKCSPLYPIQECPVEVAPELMLECGPRVFERPHFVPVGDHAVPYKGKFAPERRGVFTRGGRPLASLMERDPCANLNSERKERHHEAQEAKGAVVEGVLRRRR